jgi:VWFA-related protein
MRAVPRHVAPLLALLLTCSAASAVAGQGQGQAQDPQPQAPRIRVSVDVVAVDVQVIDSTGRPVANLGPEKFSVTINGRRRRVVSAEQISSDGPAGAADGPSVPGTRISSAPERVIMIAVDCISFDTSAAHEVIQNVQQFLRRLEPDDYVGLSAYPNGAVVTPTTNHAEVLRALNTIVGQRDGPGLNRFHIRPSEIIDANRDLYAGGGATLEAVVRRECGLEPDPNCRYQLEAEITNSALYYEGQATASLGMLRSLVTQMQRYPGRKTLLLVSGGMIASDSPGGRPDLGGLGIQVGREAAAANTAIYTLYIDSTLHDRFGAETRNADRTVTNQLRDRAVLARWLEQFTGAAGGALFAVQLGNADAALARIQTELSSYYLLGVEPAEEDRNGRTHEVSVKVTQPNLTIRGRRWVMIPTRSTAAAAAEPVASPASAGKPPAAPPPPPRHTVPAEVTALADVFDRADAAGFEKALYGTDDLPNLLRGFRQSDSPWPENRRRTAVFALELAIAGLRSNNRDARDEGGRLLAEYGVRLREPGGADSFECWWFVTEASALVGMFSPENALLFIPRSLQRCPNEPRLRLAHAVVSEQQWLRGRTTAGQEADILNLYEQAIKFPETAVEARVRAARFLYGMGEFDRGVALLKEISTPAADLELRYLANLVRGQLLRGSGRHEEAAAAFRAALQAWPGAQSARVALMTLQVVRGNRDEAAALSEEVQVAAPDQYDPWWTYWLGDYRIYPAILGKLREMGR